MPEKIGKYEIQEKIGTGGFGVVYKAHDPHIKRVVAIKTCEVEDSEIKRRFFREAELAGNLHHPNITIIYDFGVENDIPYLVQEFLSGDDLDKTIKKGVPLTLRRKIEILMDAGRGLRHAHDCGVIHRDVKPSNIRITDEGDVKILDFGIAKSSAMASKLTQTGITMGTAAYLAPEQIQGANVDPRTDIFSFGVLMYELFTGVKPFTGDNISQIIYQIINIEPTPPTNVVPDLPSELEPVILTCLAKKADQRYQSFNEVLMQLEKVLTQFTNLDLDNMVIITSAQRPTRPITASQTVMKDSAETTEAEFHKRPFLFTFFIILICLGVVLALGYGWYSKFWLDQPHSGPAESVLVINPLKLPAAEDPFPGVPEEPPWPEEDTSTTPSKPATSNVTTGTLLLSSNLTSRVSVNGKSKGTVPPLKKLTLPAGTYTVEWTREGIRHEESVTVSAGKTARVSHNFPQLRYGRLNVRTPIGSPFGYVYIDGRKVGHTPLNMYKISVGKHLVEVRREGYKAYSQEIEIIEGHPAEWIVELVPGGSK